MLSVSSHSHMGTVPCTYLQNHLTVLDALRKTPLCRDAYDKGKATAVLSPLPISTVLGAS